MNNIYMAYQIWNPAKESVPAVTEFNEDNETIIVAPEIAAVDASVARTGQAYIKANELQEALTKLTAYLTPKLETGQKFVVTTFTEAGADVIS